MKPRPRGAVPILEVVQPTVRAHEGAVGQRHETRELKREQERFLSHELGAKSGHTIRLRTKKASARYKTVLLTKRTSSAVMPGATSIARATIARGVGAVWSRGDSGGGVQERRVSFTVPLQRDDSFVSFSSHRRHRRAHDFVDELVYVFVPDHRLRALGELKGETGGGVVVHGAFAQEHATLDETLKQLANVAELGMSRVLGGDAELFQVFEQRLLSNAPARNLNQRRGDRCQSSAPVASSGSSTNFLRICAGNTLLSE